MKGEPGRIEVERVDDVAVAPGATSRDAMPICAANAADLPADSIGHNFVDQVLQLESFEIRLCRGQVEFLIGVCRDIDLFGQRHNLARSMVGSGGVSRELCE